MSDNLVRAFIVYCILLAAATNSSAQKSCPVPNLWVNGNFEDTTLSCTVFNPVNKLSNPNPPWYGFAMFRWQPLSLVQPTYLNEATTDHTLGTKYGHYLYIDPRAQSGYKYQFYQNFKVQKSTWYNFSMWYCSMNKPGNPGATIRLAVNNKAITADVTIANNNDVWVQIKGSWFSGTDTTALAALETLSAQVHGHDFAIDDIVFGTGLLISDAGPDFTACSGLPVSLKARTGAQLGSRCRSFSYEWQPATQINGNNKLASVTLKSPATPGKYWLKVTDLNGVTCTDTMTLSITTSKPVTRFNDTSLCPGQSMSINIPGTAPSFTWQDGSTANPRTISQPGLYIIAYKDACGTAYDSIRVTKDTLLKPDLGPDTLLCKGQNYICSLSGNYKNIQWDDGSSGSSIAVSATGTHWVKVWNYCDTFTDTVRVRFIDLPAPFLKKDTNYCDSIIYHALVPASWQGGQWWDGMPAQQRIFRGAGTYTISYSNKCGTVRDSIRLIAQRIAPFSIGNDTTLCLSAALNLTAPAGYYYRWTSGQTTRGIAVASAGMTGVTITNAFGCTRSDSMNITALSTSEKLFMPTAFTPDGNVLNDRYPFRNFPQPVSFRIYNRWGMKVFETEQMDTWDGNYQGQPAQEGVYAWMLIYIDCSGFRKSEQGNFTLLR